jgi:hypothetical protein
MSDNANVIRMFWHGAALSSYERLSIASFLKHGHRVEVFSYNELILPDGAVRVDASTVLPESEVFAYRHGTGKGSVSAFSNLFRYKMLHDLGGIWADCDVLCLRSMHSLPVACVAWEDSTSVNSGVMRFPPGHALPGELYRQAAALGKDIVWGQIGPQLLTRLLPQFPDVEILSKQSFYPVHWREAWRLVQAGEYDYCAGAAEGSYAVHWWNEIFRRIGISKEKLPPRGSFLEHHASDILDGDIDAWPEAMVATWVVNYRNADMPGMFKQYREGRGDLADVLRDLGMEQMKAGCWQKAVEALAAAHHVRPGGTYIRLLLAQSLIALGKPGESEPHLRAALENPATRAHAAALRRQILGTPDS